MFNDERTKSTLAQPNHVAERHRAETRRDIPRRTHDGVANAIRNARGHPSTEAEDRATNSDIRPQRRHTAVYHERRDAGTPPQLRVAPHSQRASCGRGRSSGCHSAATRTTRHHKRPCGVGRDPPRGGLLECRASTSQRSTEADRAEGARAFTPMQHGGVGIRGRQADPNVGLQRIHGQKLVARPLRNIATNRARQSDTINDSGTSRNIPRQATPHRIGCVGDRNDNRRRHAMQQQRTISRLS